MGSNVLLGEQWFPPCYAPMETILVQYFPDGGVMNTDISQCKRGLQILRCYPGVLCDLMDYCRLHLALGVIFIGQLLLERATIVLNFLHLYTICPTVDWWSPTSLEMVL